MAAVETSPHADSEAGCTVHGDDPSVEASCQHEEGWRKKGQDLRTFPKRSLLSRRSRNVKVVVAAFVVVAANVSDGVVIIVATVLPMLYIFMVITISVMVFDLMLS